jgi:hypothetical protein
VEANAGFFFLSPHHPPISALSLLKLKHGPTRCSLVGKSY